MSSLFLKSMNQAAFSVEDASLLAPTLATKQLSLTATTLSLRLWRKIVLVAQFATLFAQFKMLYLWSLELKFTKRISV
jgi:hypothetical protein